MICDGYGSSKFVNTVSTVSSTVDAAARSDVNFILYNDPSLSKKSTTLIFCYDFNYIALLPVVYKYNNYNRSRRLTSTREPGLPKPDVVQLTYTVSTKGDAGAGQPSYSQVLGASHSCLSSSFTSFCSLPLK